MEIEQQKTALKVSKNIGIPFILIAAFSGALAGFYAIQSWMPGLSASIQGQDHQAFWFLSRGTAIVAYILLWLNMTLGIGITGKITQMWPGSLITADLHRYLSILGLLFAVAHGLLLLGDHYLNYTLLQILIPFSSNTYRPFWVGVGQSGIYLWGIVFLTNYIRSEIGKTTWRVLHYISFIVFLAAMLHGIMAGTDTTTPWMNGIYWSTASVFTIALFYRIISSVNNVNQSKNADPGN